MKLNILDYKNNVYKTDIDLNDIDFIKVKVITGDEILTVHLKNETIYEIDAQTYGSHRIIDFFDYSYTVNNNDLEKWNNRIDTYQYDGGGYYE